MKAFLNVTIQKSFKTSNNVKSRRLGRLREILNHVRLEIGH